MTSTCPTRPALEVPDLLAPYDELLARIRALYRVTSETVTLGTTSIVIVRVADPDALVETVDPATFAQDERLPYWSDLWSSSIALARWCEESPWIGGKTFLELGCGVGLAGLAAARAGARVTMTDYELDALAFAACNARRNLKGPLPNIELMDWRKPGGIGRYDVIAGADIIYERRNFEPLLSLLQSALHPDGVVMLTDPDRRIGRDFLSAACAAGFALSTHLRHVERHGRMSAVTCALLQQKPRNEGEFP
jgi:ETFB lysine methyltransferase